MNDSKIMIPEGTEHLSEAIIFLPENCLFVKGPTGAGGTTVALTNSLPTVICVPYLSMIDNKINQSTVNKELYPYEVFGFHGGVSENDLWLYIGYAKVPKIMVTYDSLSRLMANLYFDASKFHLLIDEYHCLFTEYSFRNPSVRGVLRSFRDFKSFTFMSATPIDKNSLLVELEGIPMVTAVWNNTVLVSVDSINCQISIRKAITGRIKAILESDIEGNHYFFVNSVSFIKTMITNCKLTDENCRVIYSASNPAILKVKRGKASDAAKKINFITKTGFEGIDFYDKKGIIYVISEGHGSNALIDISTQLPQIAGRIRDSDYKTVICHIYSTTPISKAKSLEEFNIESEKNYQYELKAAALTKTYESEDREKLAKDFTWRYHYFDNDKKDFNLDPNLRRYEKYAFLLKNETYKTHLNVSKAYEKQGMPEISKRFQIMPKVELLGESTTSFKKMVTELERMFLILEDKIVKSEYDAFLKETTRRFPFLADALTLLGFEGIRKKDYIVGNIQKFLKSRIDQTVDKSELRCVQNLLLEDPDLAIGREILCSIVKDKLRDCYKELKLKDKVTAKHFERYFDVKVNIKFCDLAKCNQRFFRVIALKDLEHNHFRQVKFSVIT